MIDYPQDAEVDIPGIPDDVKYVGDRLDRIDRHLKELADATVRREGINPSILGILTFNGCNAGDLVGRFASSTRFRVQSVVPLVTLTTTVMSLMIGTRRIFTVRVNTGATTVQYQLPIVIDAGVDVSAEIETAQAAGGRAGFWVIGYPDES